MRFDRSAAGRVVYGPVNVPWSKGYPTPKEMTEDDLQYVEDAFVAATKRSASVGCQHRSSSSISTARPL
jgi:2,4-dienoyl-CoA reductase-like NADH-dependent reductase (Old Yellow Enzyme family)